MDGAAGDCSGSVIAIIGGGFTGAAIALNLARASARHRILIFEPAATIGPGLAYSTIDPAHRINARAQRMSMIADEPDHFCQWISATGACLDDAQAALPDGRLFPRRNVFGRYVAAQIAPLLAAGRITHIRAPATGAARRSGLWSVTSDAGQCYKADALVVATGHAPPGIPATLGGIAGHGAFIGNTLRPDALANIHPAARILIIGTGLTMADTIASLDRAGHEGEILAISRRGQSPREHAARDPLPVCPPAAFPTTARGLSRVVRAMVDGAAAQGIAWQSVFDMLRGEAQPIWLALPLAERSRLLRHVRPYWESHRHRLPPATAAVLRKRLQNGTLTLRAASLHAAAAGPRIAVTLRSRGAKTSVGETFDNVILTAGPGRITPAANPLIGDLLAAGLVTLDPCGLGVDPTATTAAARLFLAGPLTRGTFGEMISVPELAQQAAALAARIAIERQVF